MTPSTVAEIWAAGLDCKPGLLCAVENPQTHLISIIAIKKQHVRTEYVTSKQNGFQERRVFLCVVNRKSLDKKITILANCNQTPGFLDSL